MKEKPLSDLLDSFGCCKGPVELVEMLHEVEETGQPVLIYADKGHRPVAIVQPIGKSFRIATLILRAKAKIDEFEQANTSANYYLMTDGGDGVGYAEELVRILREFLVELDDTKANDGRN